MSERDELLKTFDAVRRALLENRPAALETLLSEDYRSYSPDGSRQDRAMILEAYAPGMVDLQRYDVDDVEVLMLGNAGIVIGAAQLEGRFGDETFEHDLRFISVFSRTDGAWKLRIGQVTERQADEDE